MMMMMNDYKCKDCGSKSDFPKTNKYNCNACSVKDDIIGEH
mgnify:FL=1